MSKHQFEYSNLSHIFIDDCSQSCFLYFEKVSIQDMGDDAQAIRLTPEDMEKLREQLNSKHLFMYNL